MEAVELPAIGNQRRTVGFLEPIASRSEASPLSRLSSAGAAKCHKGKPQTSVYGDVLTSDVACLWTQQKQDCAGNVLGRAKLAQGHSALAGRAEFSFLVAWIHRRHSRAGRDAVAAYAVWSPLERHLANEHPEGRLARSVTAQRRRWIKCSDGPGGDDRAAARLEVWMGRLSKQPGWPGVDCELKIEVLDAQLSERRSLNDASIADEAINSTVGLDATIYNLTREEGG